MLKCILYRYNCTHEKPNIATVRSTQKRTNLSIVSSNVINSLQKSKEFLECETERPI